MPVAMKVSVVTADWAGLGGLGENKYGRDQKLSQSDLISLKCVLHTCTFMRNWRQELALSPAQSVSGGDQNESWCPDPASALWPWCPANIGMNMPSFISSSCLEFLNFMFSYHPRLARATCPGHAFCYVTVTIFHFQNFFIPDKKSVLVAE